MFTNRNAWFACIVSLSIAIASGAASQAASPALWRIADSDSEIWIFGTVHMLPRGLSWRTPAFDAAFTAADTVYLEVDLRSSKLNRLGGLTRQLGQNANFVALSSLLGSADTVRLARVAASLGVPPEEFEPMRPWFASVTLSVLYFTTIRFLSSLFPKWKNSLKKSITIWLILLSGSMSEIKV